MNGLRAINRLNRRQFVQISALAGTGLGVLASSGCATTAGSKSKPYALRLPAHADLSIVVRQSPEASVLRTRAKEVFGASKLRRLAAQMEQTMKKAEGVGIAGPQVGVPLRVCTLMLNYKTDHPRTMFAINPLILQRSDECIEGYEGCLSVPGVGGLVRRNRWVKLSWHDLDGHEQIGEAEKHNAVLWQHELDHLDGVLYLDRLLGELLPMEEVRKRRKQLEKQLKPHAPHVSQPIHLEGSVFLCKESKLHSSGSAVTVL